MFPRLSPWFLPGLVTPERALPRARAQSCRMIIDRYLFRQVLQPLAAILGVLLAVFTSYSAAVFLADAVDGTLPAHIIAELTGLKALIALEVLIPASLYVSVLVSFARLHNDGEFTAMAAMGVRRMATMRAVLTLSAFLAVVVGSISLFVRPWAYGKLHELSTAAATLLDVDAMQAGTFYIAGKGDRVVFFDRKTMADDKAQNIFVRLRDPDRTRIIFARKAWTLPDPTPSGQLNVYLEQANIYDFHDGIRHPQFDAIRGGRDGRSQRAYRTRLPAIARLQRARLTWRARRRQRMWRNSSGGCLRRFPPSCSGCSPFRSAGCADARGRTRSSASPS